MGARERELAVRRGVHMFHLLRERRGLLTLAQIRAMSRLLADHADALYRRADGVERGSVAARVPKALSLVAIARRVGQLGQGDDPVTSATSARLSVLAERLDGRPATTAAIRAVAIDVLQLSEDVAGARHLPRWQPHHRSRGRGLDLSLNTVASALANLEPAHHVEARRDRRPYRYRGCP